MKYSNFTIMLFLLFLCFSLVSNGQDVTTVTATNDEISQNLDLEVVATVFGESKDLEDFEKRLNDPEKQISNLDLNKDGEVDYLRVVDTSKKNTHVVTIQAVIGEDKYQDVAVIDVVKDEKGETQVQVVGDVYMYGSNYIVEPVYVHQPVIYVWFWGPYYHPWHSPYYWRYYPPYYRPWRPYPVPYYRKNVRVNVNIHHKNTFHHTTVRRSKHTVKIQKKVSKRDYAKQYPKQSFESRNKGISNANQLKKTKPVSSDFKKDNSQKSKQLPSTKENSKNKAVTKPVTKEKEVKPVQPRINNDKKTGKVSTGNKVQKDWKPASEKSGNKSNVKKNKVSVQSPAPSYNNKKKSRTTSPTKSSSSNFKQSNNTKQKTVRPSTPTRSNSSMNKSYNRPQSKPVSPRPSPSRSMTPSRSKR